MRSASAVSSATRSANARTPRRGVGLGGPAAAGKDDYVKPHDVTTLTADLVVRPPFDRSSCHLRPAVAAEACGRLGHVTAPVDVPPIVSAALDLSRRGFVTSSRSETGRLLAALAARRSGRLGECGTGCGVGAAWLSTGAREGSDIVTAEVDPSLAEAVSDLFADDPRVEVITGDWGALRDYAPFSLLFLDVREAKRDRDRHGGRTARTGRGGRARRLHAVPDLAADVRGPGRHDARAVVDSTSGSRRSR